MTDKVKVTNQKFVKLKELLMELFQLDQPELDFGFYRVMHARAKEVTQFLEKDLLPQVAEVFEQYQSSDAAGLQEELEQAITQAKALGADPDTLPKVKELKSRLSTTAVDISRLESEVYDHLYTFFRRYYHEGDFLSKRVYKDGVYAIPYSGEEVKLHWANADQYYIKTDEYLKDYSFRLNPSDDKNPMRVHVRISAAKEGEHGNAKAADNAERRFILASSDFIFEEDGEQGKELVLSFEYRPSQMSDWAEDLRSGKKTPPAQKDLLQSAIKRVFEFTDSAFSKWLKLLQATVPSAQNSSRTILEKHLDRYTKRNTFDYFIHKDLGRFLGREIDFYIKNEVMHLDDVENETAPKVEQYLSKIKAIRKIASKIIEFLAQLEDFQKKLWLKKKFVIESNYCITLDRIPEEFYPEIAINEEQRKEWVKLFAIDQIKGDLITPGYTEILSPSFLKQHNKLVLDTKHFNDDFKYNIISKLGAEINLGGLLINSDNSDGLRLISRKMNSSFECIYIDPPYNTGSDDFRYKDGYRESSWLAFLWDRMQLSVPLLKAGATFAMSIDLNELDKAIMLSDGIFGFQNRRANITVKRGSVTGAKVVNPGPVNISENVILYSAPGSEWVPPKAYRTKGYDSRYGTIIDNVEADYKEWKFSSVLEKFGESVGVKKSKLRDHFNDEYENKLFDFVLKNNQRIIRFASLDGNSISKDATELKKLSLKFPTIVHHLPRKEANDYYILNGNVILFYKDRLINFGNSLLPGEPVSDIWDDVLPNDLHNEGGVALRKGKKPEKLISRIFDGAVFSSGAVLDYFAGSGTSAAVAIKKGLTWINIESANYINDITLVRLKNVLSGEKSGISKDLNWKGGGCFKYISLESYEDVLNNLETTRAGQAQLTLESKQAQGIDRFKERYMLKYMLAVETKGSQSLLNIQAFIDPTAYRMKIKLPGTDESKLVNVDLLETFNWLLGITVNHIAAPQTFTTSFKRDNEKRLIVSGQLKQEDAGLWWFRTVTGKDSNGRKILVIWRKRPGGDTAEGIEQDNLVLNEWFRKLGFSTKDSEFDVIYVNGSSNLENVRTPDERWKVRLIEEDFMRLMFDVEEV